MMTENAKMMVTLTAMFDSSKRTKRLTKRDRNRKRTLVADGYLDRHVDLFL